uniref:Uncharacterized protein n=1 Tax=Oryza rufipogon TaxID=4529 RepID=A0A0E0QQ16_ORYRU
MEQKHSGGKGRTSSKTSTRDVKRQKPVVAVGVSSPVSSSKQHNLAEAEDGTVSANGVMQQKPAADWNGFVHCMDTASRSEEMNHCLQKYDIHLDGI